MRQDDKTNLVLAKERVSPSPTNAPNLVPMVVVVVVVVVEVVVVVVVGAIVDDDEVDFDFERWTLKKVLVIAA